MMDKSVKNYFRIQFLAILSVTAIFFIYDLCPGLVKVVRLKTKLDMEQRGGEILSKTEVERRRQERLNLLASFQSGKDQMVERTERIKQQLSEDKNVPQITLEIEDLASSSSVELKSVRALKMINEEEYEILPIEIGFISEYAAILEFLSVIEKSPLMMTVQNLTISKEAKDYPLLHARLTVYVMFRNKSGQAEAAK